MSDATADTADAETADADSADPPRSARDTSNENRPLLEEWPLSNYPILVAVLLLVATALALVVSTEEAANTLATYAYYALVVGVALRLVETAAGERWAAAGDVVRESVGGLASHLERRLASSGDGTIPVAGRRVDHESRDEVLNRVERARTAARARNVDVVVRWTFGSTLFGGILLLAYWWQQPYHYVSAGFLFGWATFLALLAGFGLWLR